MNPTDEYMTPPSAWEAIQKYIPKNKVIWEAFYGDGKSGDTLRTLGFKVIHDKVDFFENNLGDVILRILRSFLPYFRTFVRKYYESTFVLSYK